MSVTHVFKNGDKESNIKNKVVPDELSKIIISILIKGGTRNEKKVS